MNCFEILGLPTTATAEAVKTAYRRLAAEVHPDHGGDSKQFIRLHLAYKQAMAEAEKPLVCQTCRGLGTTALTRGWSMVRLTCTSCHGSGFISR